MAETLHCVECGTPFESRRSLHAHIKAHQMTLGDYYVKNFPRYDFLTKEPIPFKNYENYVATDFRHKRNMYEWLKSIPRDEAIVYCKNAFNKHMDDGRKLKFAPNHIYLMTHPRLPKKEFFSRASLESLFSRYGMISVQNSVLSECPDFGDIPKDMVVLEDSREQQPLKFAVESQRMKLDFGDYTATGKDYSYLYVDRKSESDFKGTVSGGYERFCRELDRVREFSSYLFIVVESDFRQIHRNNNNKDSKKVNLDFVWENTRNIIADYSDVCQFVFTGSRENSQTLIPYLLINGNGLKSVDIQYYMEKFQCLG